MDGLEIVGQIVELNFKSGVSAKTNKPWAMHKYRTNTGKEFTSFDDLQEGDSVKLTYSDEYKNWSGGRVRKQDTQHDEIMDMLKKILSAVSGSQEMKKPAQTATGLEQARTKAAELRTQPKQTSEFSDADMPDFEATQYE